MTETTGLFSTSDQAPIALTGVAVHATITGHAAQVTVAQHYVNRETRPIEAVYVFPLPSDAAIAGFVAVVDGRRIEGRVEERDRAFDSYDDALAAGHGAFLLDQERPNIFTASVGNLRPGATVTLEIRYVVYCATEGDAIRFQLPTTISPRYTPPSTTPEVGQPDAERVNPERQFKVPYGLSLIVDIAGRIARVESPSHPIRTTLSDDSATIELAHEQVALDRDFVLLVAPAAPAVPTARVARDEQGTRYLAIDFVPTFAADDDQGLEVIFVVDCSGSMAGDSIAQAKKALELCIRALSQNDTFDIVRFGSRFETLFGHAKPLDAGSLAAAVTQIAQTEADFGGTEILAPLAEILHRPVDAARPRQVLLLTDGQVSNENEVIALAHDSAATARIFTFGIGAGVSEHLVKELAKTTRGEVELIYPGERIEPKVLRHFGRLRTPTLADIRIEWGGLEVEQTPRTVPPVFRGDPLTVYARLRPTQPSAVAATTLMHITLSGGTNAWRVAADLERPDPHSPIPKLWARSAIRDLERDTGRHGSAQDRSRTEDRDAAKRKKLVDLGVAYGLLSSVTSYVAVEVRTDADRTTAAPALRKVPVALTAGWGGHGTVFGGLGAPGAAPTGRPNALKKRMARPAARAVMFAHAGTPPPSSIPSPAPREAAVDDARAARNDALDRLYDVLLTQAPDGSFALSEPLLAWCGDRADRARSAASNDAAVVATSIVLFLLERDENHRRDEWRAAADKARRFIATRQPFDAAALFA